MCLDKLYMQRCLDLAIQGKPDAFPNPLVGCVIVKNNRIISEGYHKKFGEKHAEIEAINKIKDKTVLEGSDIYINLEPCSHYGKTPPCVNEIIKYKFNKIVIGTQDPFKEVNGKGIQKLKKYNLKINCLENECKKINKRFFINNTKNRPYIILKWAQTKNNFIGNKSFKKSRLIISNNKSLKMSHKWRSTEAAILIGKNTALKDNPRLTTRLCKGRNPIRIILDQNLELKKTLNVFNKEVETLIINNKTNAKKDNVQYIKISNDKYFLQTLCSLLYKRKIYSIIVEGGAAILKLFIKEKLWDEARVFTSQKIVKEGLTAPLIKNKKYKKYSVDTDSLTIYSNN